MSHIPQSSPAHGYQSPPPPPPPPKTAAPQPYPPSNAYRVSESYDTPPPVPPPPHASRSAQSPQDAGAHNRSPTDYALPEEGWVPDVIKDMSKADLDHLLQTPDLLHALVHDPEHMHPSLAQSQVTLAAALEHTAQLAEQANTMSRQLAAHREQTSAHLVAARAAEQSWRRREGEMETALAPFAPRALHARLGHAIGEQEEVCRAVEEGWVDVDGVATEREVGEWIKRVREGRRTLELRRERKARWDEGRVGGWR